MYSILELIQRLNIGSGGTDLSGAEGAAACGAADYERYLELINLTHEPFRKLGEVCGFVVSLEPDPVGFYDGLARSAYVFEHYSNPNMYLNSTYLSINLTTSGTPISFYEGSDITLIAGEEVTYTDEENLGATSVFTLTTSG